MIIARVVQRVQTGESAVEVAAWLVDLGYWSTAEDVAAIVARHGQRRDDAQSSNGSEGSAETDWRDQS